MKVDTSKTPKIKKMEGAKTIMCIPCKGDIPIETVSSIMGLEFGGASRITQGSLIDDMRDAFAMEAIEEGFTHLLFVDADMTFEGDAYKQLLADDKDVVSGIFHKRAHPYTPTIVKDGKIYIDYPQNELFEVDTTGMAFTLIKVSALKAVMDEFHTCFKRAYPLGEDNSFCMRWKELGKKLGKEHKIYCDSRVKVGHIGKMIVRPDVVRSMNYGTKEGAK